LANISKNFQKIFFFILVSEITNLYVKRIPGIKKVILSLTLEWLRFTRKDKDLPYQGGLFLNHR